MKPEEKKFMIILLQVLRKGNVISDAVAGNAMKSMNKMGDADASFIC